MSIIHIRRICDNDVKGSRSEYPAGFLNISVNNLNFFFQAIERYASGRHFRNFFLNLQAGKMLSLRLCRKEKGDDPRSRPQIQNLLSRLYCSKSRKQNCIHSKTESIRFLNDFQSISLQIIQPFLFF